MLEKKLKLPQYVIDKVIHSLRHVLLDQSSISADFIRNEDFSMWNIDNVKFIKDSLENIESNLKDLEYTE